MELDIELMDEEYYRCKPRRSSWLDGFYGDARMYDMYNLEEDYFEEEEYDE